MNQYAPQVTATQLLQTDSLVLHDDMPALQADWRSVLPRISIPCLNLVGSKTMCFNAKGVAYVGENVPKCEQVLCLSLQCIWYESSCFACTVFRQAASLHQGCQLEVAYSLQLSGEVGGGGDQQCGAAGVL